MRPDERRRPQRRRRMAAHLGLGAMAALTATIGQEQAPTPDPVPVVADAPPGPLHAAVRLDLPRASRSRPTPRPTPTLAVVSWVYPTPAQWAALRNCESGGNYRTNTGNGYYGAVQWDFGTWRGLWLRTDRPDLAAVRPDRAAPAIQDTAAVLLWRERGWVPWPACSLKLGFR